MLNVTYKPFILSGIKLNINVPNVIMLSVVMLIVVAPSNRNMVRHFYIPGKTLVAFRVRLEVAIFTGECSIKLFWVVINCVP